MDFSIIFFSENIPQILTFIHYVNFYDCGIRKREKCSCQNFLINTGFGLNLPLLMSDLFNSQDLLDKIKKL